MNKLNTIKKEDTRKYNGGQRSMWDFFYDSGRACVNYGIMIGNRIFKKNARYI